MGITVTPTRLSGVVIVDTDYFRDERGFFIESWHRSRFEEHGIAAEFVQDNHSQSARGVLRGIHWQDMTAPMGKLVRCSLGSVFDVAVDLRAGSPTFGRWEGFELSADNMRQLWIPPGFGHAFLTLSERADVQYKCSGYYTPEAEGALRWDDPDVGVDWPVRDVQVSARDRAAGTLQDYLANPAFTY